MEHDGCCAVLVAHLMVVHGTPAACLHIGCQHMRRLTLCLRVRKPQSIVIVELAIGGVST